jgi:hypothetical protein
MITALIFVTGFSLGVSACAAVFWWLNKDALVLPW